MIILVTVINLSQKDIFILNLYVHYNSPNVLYSILYCFYLFFCSILYNVEVFDILIYSHHYLSSHP